MSKKPPLKITIDVNYYIDDDGKYQFDVDEMQLQLDNKIEELNKEFNPNFDEN